MDTRFWGPSGWKLLHLIAAEPGDAAVYEWFALLPFVLPCKYCRASLQEYYEKKPLSLELVRSANFGHWLYEIHNMVNAKLRDQGLLNTSDPSWISIKNYYKSLRASLCGKSPIIGWDFFASIAYTTPTKGIVSKPMPDNPEKNDNMTLSDRNRYNMLTPKERIAALRKWWHLLPEILPCSAWKAAWNCSKEPPLNRGRGPVSCWLWAIEEAACETLQCPTPHVSLPTLKTEMSAFESACGSSSTKKTCRAKRKALRRAAMTRRAQNGGSVF